VLPCLIFEDDHLLVVSKPAGLNTHAPSPYAGEGLYDWLRHRETRWAKLAIVQRLDKETSGVMVFSKSPLANRALTRQFTDRVVRKKYLLLTDRPVHPREMKVESTLVRAGNRYVSRPLHPSGETAQTHFRVLGEADLEGGNPKAEARRPKEIRNPKPETRRGSSEGGWYELVEAEPLTGRTHQIRVHAAEKGFPILGDTLYGGTPARRVYLHAAELTLRHPASGQEMTFRAPFEQGIHLAGAAQCPSAGVRPSSGAATSASSEASKLPGVLDTSGAAAPEDGRTPAPQRRDSHEPAPADLAEPGDGLRWLTGPLPCLSLREALIEPEQTNAYRVIHGASDGWPAWYLERLGDFLLSQSEHALHPAQREELARLAKTFAARGVYHKILTRQVRRAAPAEASPQLVLGEAAPERFTVRENGVQFELSFAEGYSVGLFLDQRDNRRRLLTGHVAAGFSLLPSSLQSPITDRRLQILNTFAYTCGFSVCAAKTGARTTSLDLSKKCLDWGKRNFAVNQLDPAAHDFIYGDVFDWLRRLARKQRLYDVILLDPPTFSQSKESGVFRADKDYGRLVMAALPLLRTGGVLFASTNAADWPPEEFLAAVTEAIHRANRKILQQHYAPQPPDFPITRAEPAYLKTVWLRVE
jgi:23S rRNA (cytosine1962-C5)-methyltransferase